MNNFDDFNKNFPKQSMQLSEAIFTYRHYKKPKSKATLVLLTGGLGLSDLIYLHFQEFSKHFSVISFDYPTYYQNNEELAGAIGELLTNLDIKVWFVGQSYGGFLAQIIAKNHPQVVDGLVLSNTGCLAKDMSQTAYDSLMDMLKSSKSSKKILTLIPF